MTKKTETKPTTTEVKAPEAVKRLIGEPGVIAIAGEILEPVATFKKEDGQAIVYNGITLVKPHFTPFEGEKNPVLNLYTYALKKDKAREIGLSELPRGTDIFIVADELSSLDMGSPNYVIFREERYVVITLLNSRSKNDYFGGDVLLSCVDSEDNSFENSTIQVSHVYYGFAGRRIGMKSLAGPSGLRERVVNVQTESVEFTGRQLPSGYYRNSDIRDNTFVRPEREGNKEVTIVDSTVSWTNFREATVDIHNAHVSHCQFFFAGNITLKRITLEREHFGNELPGVYLTSPFDITSIDVMGTHPAKMIRVDKDNVFITLPSSVEENEVGKARDRKLVMMSFRNPQARRALRIKTYETLFGDSHPSEMEESVMDYFLDTVLSRCSMMNLMDTADRLLRSTLMGVKQRNEKEVNGLRIPLIASPGRMSEYDGVTSLANEYDKTIYIDGKNFNS